VDPLRLFAALSGGGAEPHAFLLESADLHKHNAVKSLGCADPCLCLEGRDGAWTARALRPTGQKALAALRYPLAVLSRLKETPGDLGPAELSGVLPARQAGLEERDRLRAPGPMDLLRAIQHAFTPQGIAGFPAGGLFGAFSYDFVDCYEELPRGQSDSAPVPDFVFTFADHLFLVDHLQDRCIFVATVLGVEDSMAEYHLAQERIRRYEEIAAEAPPLPPLPPLPPGDPAQIRADLDDAEYAAVVDGLQEHIRAGDVFQIVPSRGFEAPLREAPLAVYRRLRALNPSPYMFFFRREDITLVGASPEMAIKVAAPGGDQGRRVMIRPIAGTRPRGLREGAVDPDQDSRYEAELKLDAKEQAEHVMLVDLARNDVARVCKPASRQADRLFAVEKYSHVQHLVSRISGELDDGLDPLHAYLATMNMGTLTGAPKVEAMRLLREVERTRRGFYGGAAGYYMLDGELNMAIVIRSLLLVDGRALTRAGAGVVYDSVPAREAEETLSKARAPLAALGYRFTGSPFGPEGARSLEIGDAERWEGT
jgi:anthranilate synthase component 1